jgi:hypothetical protein
MFSMIYIDGHEVQQKENIMNMPILNFENLNGVELAIATKIVGKGNKLRATKPSDGEALYVWRLVVFMVSPKPAHHCMPCTHDFGVMDIAPKVTKFCKFREKEVTQIDFDWVRARCKELDVIVNKIVDNVNVHQRHGVNRWARAYGVI